MRFRQLQDEARVATRALVVLFALTVLLTVLGVNLALALAWRLQSGGLVDYPAWFFQTNTAVTLGFVLGGAWLESLQLRGGGEHVARLLGGREVVTAQTAAERRLRNVVDEMAIAARLKAPRVFVLEREDAINSLASGWEQHDSVVVVTRGALERLTRDELQGVVAHEFAHILHGDTRLNMRLIGMVFGLQLVFNFGRSLMAPDDRHGRRGPGVLIGLALMAAGSIGWLAGRLLKAGVSRQREYLADAAAVQFTRLPSGLGNALRKVAGQLGRGQRLAHVNAEVVSPLLLSSDTLARGGWLATHPPIAQRLRRIFGHEMAPLPDEVLAPTEAPPSARELPALDFVAPAGDAAMPPAALDGVGAAVLSGFADLTGPERLRAAVLACLMPAGGEAAPEQAVWRQSFGQSAGSLRVLQAVRALPPRQRQPWFERVLGQAAALPAPERKALVRDAIAVVQADGHLSLHEYLLARVLQQQLSARRPLAQRPLAMAPLAEAVTAVTTALAALWPAAAAATWRQQVLGGLGLPSATASTPSLRELSAALDQLAALGRLHRPALAKQWSEALPDSDLPPALADALRCLCLLVDTPLPPRLAAMFDPLPPLAEPAFEPKP